MRVLIMGLDTPLRRSLIRNLKNSYRVMAPELGDWDSGEQIYDRAFDHFDPHIILALPPTFDVADATKNYTYYLKVNAQQSQCIKKSTCNSDKRVFYFSSDMVFDGIDQSSSHPWGLRVSEGQQKIRPSNDLGTVHAVGEHIFKEDAVIIRSSCLFDWSSDNFITETYKKIIQEVPQTLPTKLITIPTYLPDLARFVHYLIVGGSSDKEYHYTNKGVPLSQYGLGRYIHARSQRDFQTMNRALSVEGLAQLEPCDLITPTDDVSSSIYYDEFKPVWLNSIHRLKPRDGWKFKVLEVINHLENRIDLAYVDLLLA